MTLQESGPGFPQPRQAGDGLEFGPDVAVRARTRFPELYRSAVCARGSFDAILQARRLRRPPLKDPGDWEVSHYLEGLLRGSFEAQFGRIANTYWCQRAYGGGLVTDRGLVTSSLRSRDEELMTIEFSVKQLGRDAQRIFAHEISSPAAGAAGSTSSDRQMLPEVSATLFSVLSRVLDTADVLEDASVEPARQRAAVEATRAEWRLARRRALVLIQRQASYEYFVGVMLGTPFAIAVFGCLGLLAATVWSSSISASNFLAATVCGTLGAVVSVTQRMATGRLSVDYTASVRVKRILGAWRPFLGGILAGVLQFAIIGGLLTVQGREPTPASPATFAFYALVGFAGGFSERLATDLLERAGQLIAPVRTDGGTDTTTDGEDDVRPAGITRRDKR